MVASSSSIKVFFNEEIRKKYEELFASRPFIYEKSFDTKNESNVGYTPEFMVIVKKHNGHYLDGFTKRDLIGKRLALKSQARGWNHFLKASLMPTSHNETVSEEQMALLHSIITGREINV
ncbi:hypothetical protein V6N12_035730 [Hibiscus sabdariffa]|uniref:Uncharacterized protein n=1 Tax=Hibiscus sabdariffa TaxID=183260 RepID=A0ABR2EQB7_9ROSI